MIKATKLVPRFSSNTLNPYLLSSNKIKVFDKARYLGVSAGRGSKVLEKKDRDKNINDSLSPVFDRCYELQIVFPRHSELFISTTTVLDHLFIF